MARNTITLKDPLRESALFNSRTIVMFAATLVAILLLVGRLAHLQIANHDHFTTLSHNNRVSIEPLAPTRGLIYDRNGVVLAENLPSFSLEIVPERVPDLEATIEALKPYVAISDENVKRFRELLRRKRRFEGVPLRLQLSDAEVARLSVRRHQFPGVNIEARLMRHYPLGELTSHVVGYVGRINERELRTRDLAGYSATTHIGKVGVERSYESHLHGQVGHQQVETNAQGRVLRVLERTPPQPGRNLHLNIDVNLHAAAKKAFGEENGALVAIDPKTGAVLALVSVPGFAPQPFVNGIDTQTYRALTRSIDLPLFNRALQGQYPPGSTTKPFLALAGLELGQIDVHDHVVCRGWYMLEGEERRYRDWKRQGHGRTNMDKALVESCDVYFYDLAHELGIDKMHTYMSAFGFGSRTGIDLLGELSGLMPSRDWKRRVHNLPWFPGETLIAGIGQGFTLATPLQLASATATLANGGKALVPRVVAALGGGAERESFEPEGRGNVVQKKPQHWEAVLHSMERVVHSARGTARGLNTQDLTYRIGAKTGTAQVFGIAQDGEYVAEDIAKKLRDHALFIGYAPAEDPRIAVAVIVENGGSGGAVAGPVGRAVMDAYLESIRDETTR